MVRRLIIVAGMLFGVPAPGAESTALDNGDTFQTLESKSAMLDAKLTMAKSIVNSMVVDKTSDEVLAMVNEIALALSNEDLCGPEAVDAMLDVYIPFDLAFDSIVQVCKLTGAELAALSRSLAPGMQGSGGPGLLVSP